jgi:ELWxxDGT repeat protein
LYFTTYDSVSTYKLWKSNGTTAGTVIVKDLNSAAYPAYKLTNFNGTLYFFAGDGTNGTELWKSDGTPAGTVMVKDINPGINHSFYYSHSYYSYPHLTNVNGTLYFAANNGTNGTELWKSDGTTAGTVMVKNIGTDIYRFDTGKFIPNSSNPDYLTNANGTLFFSATTHLVGSTGRELWKSNGTSTTTVLVQDIVPGTGSSHPTGLTNVNGTVYFGVYTASGDYELWKSNGTGAGTVKVYPFSPSICPPFC